MKTAFRTVSLLLFVLSALPDSPALGQVLDQLKYSIPALGDGTDLAQFGYSVAVDGRYAVIGAGHHEYGFEPGHVKVFDSNTGELLFVLPNPTPVDRDNFGFSVAISGTRVVVGAYGDDTGALDAGSAYVFDLASDTPTLPIATLN